MIEGRIVKGVGGLYSISTEQGLFLCKPRGLLRKQKLTPTIGDYVLIETIPDENLTATLHTIKERKNVLLRPKVSNVDQAVIVFAIKNPVINLDMLDRFIILAEEQQLEILICINKIDLVEDEAFQQLKDIYTPIGYETIFVSTREDYTMDSFRKHFENKVSVFAGPSGVGKSSIINMLLNADKMEIGGLSEKIQRGKHTTRHAELIEINRNSFIVDSPGFTSISLDHISTSQLSGFFREFEPLIGKCRFKDCNHLEEPDCAIKAQVGKSISELRYKSYVYIYTELSSQRRK